ncbi:hypothetical protein [Streptosporangium sp. NPDC000396]|uniref:hypothetical protein n=1 Tax=Streptosporangium sp. NPDC000396 TaxID=3366185 RepID=UPI0036AA4C47
MIKLSAVLFRLPGKPWLREHRAMIAALALAAVVRAVTMAAYPPVLWFWADSFSYLRGATVQEPSAFRPIGYSFLLKLLQPLHSLEAVAVLQHLIGLAVAVLVYVPLRRVLPGWAATLVVVPVLFDELQILLEHMILAETLFTLLVTGAVAVLMRRAAPVVSAAAGGALLGLAAVTRVIGLPLVAVAAVCLIVRRAGWRAVSACVLAATIPIASYSAWVQAERGTFGLTEADGIFLWARTTTFADCSRIMPPPEEAALCPRMPRRRRPPPANWIWHGFSPINRGALPKGTDVNAVASRFARRAIMAQPGDFLATGTADLVSVFRWSRRLRDSSASKRNPYEFPGRPWKVPGDSSQPSSPRNLATGYDSGDPDTRIVQPYASWMRAYQRWAYTPGPVLLVILLVGLGGVVVRRRMEILLPWAVATALVIAPPFVTGFDARYAIPALPLAFLSAGLALAPKPSRSRRLDTPVGDRAPGIAKASVNHFGPAR